MKKSTKLVSAVVVLAVLGGVYVGLNTYVSKEEQTESSSEEENKTKVFSVKTEDIKSLEFIVDKKETTFEKKDDSLVCLMAFGIHPHIHYSRCSSRTGCDVFSVHF